jgi:SAM-dependent methyltransferase
MSTYALSGHPAELARLRFLSSSVAAVTEAVLDRVPVPPGARILDVGSGNGRLAADLAAADPRRTVVGVDADLALLDAARADAAGRGLRNVSFQPGSADALPFGAASFDLVTCRFVLMHLADPAKALAESCRVGRPGGAVALIESDWGGQLVHPASAAVQRFQDLAVRVARHVGINPYQGRELVGLVRAAGLRDIRVTAHAEVSTADDAAVVAAKLRSRLAMLSHLAPRLHSSGVFAADDFGCFERDVEALLASPDLFAGEYRVAVTARIAGPGPACSAPADQGGARR